MLGDTHVLYFTAGGHTLYRASRSGLEVEERFAPDEAGVEAFRAYLRGQRGALFSLLADLAGEDFHEDQIPFLRGGDRDAVVQRRVAQRYRDTRLAAALSLGYVAAGERKNERLLLASFTNTQQITPWLDALDDAGARLAGVYSVPLLAPAVAARLGVKGGRAFVISANRAGLRQCFIDDGRLRFARLERTADMDAQALGTFVRSETQRLAQYLSTLRVLPREGEPVQVTVIAPQGARTIFERELVSDARLVFHTVEAAEAARSIGLSRPPEGALAEALYAYLAARKPPREQFASRADRRRYFIWQLQRGVVAAGALGFVACALVGGNAWLEARGLRERAALQGNQARSAAEQYRRITAAFPVTQTSTDNLKIAVVEFQRIAQRSALPEQGLVHVSRVLEDFPQMELDALAWSAGNPATGARTPPAGGAAQAAKSTATGTDDLRIEVSGRVNATQRDDYRGITAQVQRFAQALGSSGFEVVATKLPFDITPEGTLTGDIGGADTGEAPRFTVTVARSLK
ncbi:MAG TPA: hypothetical protein VEB41_12085 [Burkholderiales bacterium]|nr:hypothetical protein [Burkholderiales bacterium]